MVLLSLLLTAPQIGLSVGETMPSFEPTHITGPDQGTKTCPVCQYIDRPMAQMWVSGESDGKVSRVARAFEKACADYSAHEFKAFLIFVTKPEQSEAAKAHLQGLAKESSLTRTALTILDPKDDGVSATHFPLRKEVRNVVYVYVRRKITAKWVNFAPTEHNLKSLGTAMKAADAAARRIKKS